MRRLLFLLSACVAIPSVFLLIRIFYTGDFKFLFLEWNLFLAIIPLLVSHFLLSLKRKLPLLLLGLITIFWLLFLPNAPYIFTDLLHLRYPSSAPMWYNLLLILSFAIPAFLVGIVSTWQMVQVWSQRLNKYWLLIGLVGVSFSTGFGIYLGRFLRWNSWDVITNPQGVIYDVLVRVIHPLAHSRTWAITICFGLLISFSYFTFTTVLTEIKQNK